MSENLPPVGRDRPFPWRCTKCKAKEVYRQPTDYTSEIKHDGRTYTVRVPDLMLPTCRKCGEAVFSVGDDEPIRDALRAQLGLLSPSEIQKQRQCLEINQQELAEHLGVAKETISRWETGAMIQSRAMDNLLRLYFGSEEVRSLLKQGFKTVPAKKTSPKLESKGSTRWPHLAGNGEERARQKSGSFQLAA
jgi:putative zinc finger/helix-turn-helix YgiT family protein